MARALQRLAHFLDLMPLIDLEPQSWRCTHDCPVQKGYGDQHWVGFPYTVRARRLEGLEEGREVLAMLRATSVSLDGMIEQPQRLSHRI